MNGDDKMLAATIAAQMTHHPRPNWNAALGAVAREYAERAKFERGSFNAPKFYVACGLYADGFHWQNANEQTGA